MRRSSSLARRRQLAQARSDHNNPEAIISRRALRPRRARGWSWSVGPSASASKDSEGRVRRSVPGARHVARHPGRSSFQVQSRRARFLPSNLHEARKARCIRHPNVSACTTPTATTDRSASGWTSSRGDAGRSRRGGRLKCRRGGIARARGVSSSSRRCITRRSSPRHQSAERRCVDGGRNHLMDFGRRRVYQREDSTSRRQGTPLNCTAREFSPAKTPHPKRHLRGGYLVVLPRHGRSRFRPVRSDMMDGTSGASSDICAIASQTCRVPS